MPLTGKQLHQIQEALLNAFPSRDQLAMLVRIELDEVLDALADGANQRVLIFNLLTWAERNDRVADLIKGATNQSPRNPTLQQLAQDARTWGLTAPKLPPSSAPNLQNRDAPAAPASIDIFLSYSRRDAEIMQPLYADLRAAGFAVWIDEGLEPGTPHWEAAIEEAIEQARCLVVILTPSAKRSPWVQNEISYARELSRPIYPLLAKGDVRSAVPLGLMTVQRVDIRESYGAVAGALLPALRSFLQTGVVVELLPAPAPKPVKPEPATSIPFAWVAVPAGGFKMGSNDSDDEKPPHTVVLSAYRIAKTPVTVAQFAQFVKATGYTTTAEKEGSARGWNGAKWDDIQGAYWARPRGPKSNVDQKAEHPVTCVSWHDAMAFCQWANVRLPTEAEWEKAARGTDGRTFPWGEDEPDKDRCNYNMDVGDTTAVGSYTSGASPYGCMDMAGNVWEWCSSQYKEYPYRADDGREDWEAEERRVLRGGAFVNYRNFVRCAYRDRHNPRFRPNLVGFRVVAPGF